ncbi:MAG TPA: GNAT family N-acetyltransferase [Gaiellaceae bacterium]|nr:GNAT family N-acetyltransferase [Gaiellaceae bacterium]
MPRLATADDIPVAAEALGRAFVEDPLLTAIVGRPPDLAGRLGRYFSLECRQALAAGGEIWLDDDGLGAAIWRRPGAWLDPVSTQLRSLPAYVAIFPRRFFRASKALNATARAHPKSPPHWYLLAVGVVPEEVGRGRGSALLRPVLQRCDEERAPAYLEASTEANARLYARLGFEPRDEIDVLPGVRSRPMWREPR